MQVYEVAYKVVGKHKGEPYNYDADDTVVAKDAEHAIQRVKGKRNRGTRKITIRSVVPVGASLSF